MATRAELVIAALQERIGQMSATYETQIALLRAEITEMSDELKKLTSGKEEASNKDSN